MGKSESLYALLAERMWTVVGEALSGSDRMLLEPLQSVGESLKWEKQKEAERLGNGLETDSVSTWSPNFWRKDLEEKLMQYMTAQIPPFASSTNTDETALKQHLSHLEGRFLPSLEHRSDVFKEAGLLITYARCCHASLCSHLATLTDSNCFSFSQSLLIYEWIIKMYKRYAWRASYPTFFYSSIFFVSEDSPSFLITQWWPGLLLSLGLPTVSFIFCLSEPEPLFIAVLPLSKSLIPDSGVYQRWTRGGQVFFCWTAVGYAEFSALLNNFFSCIKPFLTRSLIL